jgi:hypothetical protein
MIVNRKKSLVHATYISICMREIAKATVGAAGLRFGTLHGT